MAHAELRSDSNSLVLLSSYDPGLVSALKAQVPAIARRWDKDSKSWYIDPMYGAVVARLVKDYLGMDIQVPLVPSTQVATTRVLKVEYLGTTKNRPGCDERSAFAWVDEGWNVIFPESVLQAWFDAAPTGPSQKPTLYGVLGIQRIAKQDDIKGAHRRLARQWHPDVNHDPEAKEQFIAIQHAYEILSDDFQRRKYDAGLQLEATLTKNNEVVLGYGYRAPLKCGYVFCVGTESVGLFHVTEIKAWEDIIADDGRVMVTSWPAGVTKFVVNWL